jgi:hypothetical protein
MQQKKKIVSTSLCPLTERIGHYEGQTLDLHPRLLSKCTPAKNHVSTAQQNAKKKAEPLVMVTKGVEPSTLALLAPRSNQLS